MKRSWVITYWLASAAAALAWGGPFASASDSDQADQVVDQVKVALDHGDYDAAIAQLDEAIRRDPNQPKLWGMRGVAWLRKGQYTKGAADLKAAIRLNPGDAGSDYPPPVALQPSSEAMHHGRQQVDQMLHDRPAMAPFAARADFLCQWAARKFAGEDFGELIDWDNSPPLHSDAEHVAPGDGDHAAILVAAAYDAGPHQGRPRSFEELWAGAVYELHNVCYARQFVRLHDEAEQGKVSKRNFVAGILKYELRAAQQTRAFYVQTMLPWLELEKLSTDPTPWFCDWWDTPAGALQNFTKTSAYPWRPYARAHDWATVRRRWYLGKFRPAFGLLEKMRAEKGYAEDEAEVCYWISRCLERLGEPAKAITALDEAIRLDPHYAAAYQSRGALHQQLGHSEQAEADRAAAKRWENAE